MEKVSFKEIKLNKYIHEIILAVFTTFYAIYFIVASFLKYDNYYNGRFDLGNMSQTVWNTFHGNIFMLTDPNGTREVSRLAFHADFILILLAPFYALWEDPRMLLLIQTIVLVFGGIFVYLIAKHVLKSKTLSLVLSVCFFLNPAVNYTNLFDFHAVTLATTFFLAAFYFILKKNYFLTIVFLILAGITKEQVWAINALFGLYLVFASKQKFLGILIFLISSLIFYLLIWYAIPNALGSQHFAVEFFSDYGTSPGDIIKNIFLHPLDSIQTLFLPDRLVYIKQLFLPLGYLSIIAFPFLIFAGPDLVINLLSSSPQMHQIYYQYSATITPFIFIGSIYAISKIRTKLPEIPDNAITAIIITLSLLSAYSYGPLPFAKKPTDSMLRKPLVNREAVDKYLSSIPKDQAISATNNLGSHLSHRRKIYVIPNGIREADQVLFLLNPNSEKDMSALAETEQNSRYYKAFQDKDFYVFKKLNR